MALATQRSASPLLSWRRPAASALARFIAIEDTSTAALRHQLGAHMNKERGEQANQDVSAKQERGKKAYQKPAFRYERVFETMALACGKINDTEAQCRGLNMAS